MKKKPSKTAQHDGKAKSVDWRATQVYLGTIPSYPYPTYFPGPTAPPVAAAPPPPQQPRPQPDVRPNEDAYAKAMRDIATAAWKLKGIVFKPGTDETVAELDGKQLADIGFYAERLYNTLATLGITVLDFTGQPFDAGMQVNVISAKPTPDLEKEIIFQTILPTLRFEKGELRKFYPGNVVTLRPAEDEVPAEEVKTPVAPPAAAPAVVAEATASAPTTVSTPIPPPVPATETATIAPADAGQTSSDASTAPALGKDGNGGAEAAGKDSRTNG